MHLLVLRFSSIGDVALTVPILLQFKKQYPEVKISMLAPKMYRSLFEPLGVHFIEADLKGQHKGAKGLLKLFKDILKSSKPDKVIDLHSVLRTHVLKAQFRLSGTSVYSIHKGRRQKRNLTRGRKKDLHQLAHTTERYAQVFKEAGYPLDFERTKPELPNYRNAESEAFAKNFKGQKLIGLAPYAAFEGKTWPPAKSKQLVTSLCEMGYTPILFGGPGDKKGLEEIKGDNNTVEILAGLYNFASEVAIMKHLLAMICMDSSNLHLATLAGTPVVSIWGATHSFAGFGPLGKNKHLQVEISTDELECRPCSVFGNKPCFRNDYACMNQIGQEDVLEKLELAIKKLS